MPWFVQHRMHEPCIDSSFLPLLRRIDRFMKRVEVLRTQRDAGAPVDLSELIEHHDAIHTLALQSHGSPPIPRPQAVEAFACGVLRVLHYPETVGRVIDGAGSKTLASFTVDLDPSEHARVRSALQRAFDLDEQALQGIDARVQHELTALTDRRAVITAIERRHDLDTPAGCHALFTELFPYNPLRTGETALVRTETSLFFCIAFKDGHLLEPIGTRTTDQDQNVRIFLERLAQFEQPYLAHFPVFGCFNAALADPELLQDLLQQTTIPAERLVRKLTTMVTVLPTPELDQYIVHDTWGHQWQALLYNFEARYQDAARYRDPPAPTSSYGAGLDLVQAARDYAHTGSMETFDRYLQAAFAHRLTTTLSGLFAEVLADAVEYKFLFQRPEMRGLMPSSSFFKRLPAKLDLTLHDLRWYFDMAQRGFERLAFSSDEATQMRDVLAKAGVPDPDTTTTALIERLTGWLDRVHRAELDYDPTNDGVYVNVFARVALHFAQLHASLNSLHERLEAHPGPLPFNDVLLFATASYYERDPNQNFWTTDEFLDQWFEVLFDQFTDAWQDNGAVAPS